MDASSSDARADRLKRFMQAISNGWMSSAVYAPAGVTTSSRRPGQVIRAIHRPDGSGAGVGHEAQRHRVHAIAQSGGARAIVEHVAEVAVATGAADRG